MYKVKILLLVLGVMVTTGGCKVGGEQNQECVDPPNTVVEKVTSPDGETTTKKKVVMTADDVNWCRACVVGPHGFMSCQRVNQENTGETEKDLRERARISACEDSGFTKENCPPEKVISVACKGDPPPKDKRAAGEALMKALKNSGPLVLTEDGTRFVKPGEKEDADNGKNGADKPADTPASAEKAPAQAPPAKN